MESWSQEAFNKAGRVTLQIVSLCFIGLQIFLTIVGAHNKDKLCFVLLAFYMVRLVQFILKANLAINIAQSNFVCVCLAVLAICTCHSRELNLFSALTCAVLTADGIAIKGCEGELSELRRWVEDEFNINREGLTQVPAVMVQ